MVARAMIARGYRSSVNARKPLSVALSDRERAAIEAGAQAVGDRITSYVRTAALAQAKRDARKAKGMKA